MALKGLVIRQPWIGMILRGEKAWEMRSTPCRHRGLIALIEKGSGTIVGLANILDDLPPLNEAELRANVDKHRIRPDVIPEVLRQGWNRPWVLSGISRLSNPVPYEHTSGGSWVNLSAAEETAVLNAVPTTTSGQRQMDATQDHSSLVTETLSHVTRQHGITLGASASTSVVQKGNRLYIDVEWEDEACRPSLKLTNSEGLDIIGQFAVVGAGICSLGFAIHFTLGLMSESVSALHALGWLIWLLGFSVLASLCGQGEELSKLFNRSRRR